MTTNAYSFSDIATFRRCPNGYRYKNILKLQRKVRSDALYQGTLVHEALMAYYLARRDPGSIGEARQAVNDFFAAAYKDSQENPTRFADELLEEKIIIEDSEDLVKRYLDKYDDETWTILHVEETFFVTMDNGQIISFTPDLVVRDRNGYVWIIDHKTTSGAPGPNQAVDTQALLYYAGVSVLYPELRGFVFNKLRKKRPTKPRLNKTGKLAVTDLNRIDTTYEILRDFITEAAPELLDDERHRRRLAELRDQERFFWREQMVITTDQADTILYEAGITINLIETVRAGGWWPRTMQEDRGYTSCSRCEFNRLCQAELLQWDVETVIQEDYEPRDAKNPYEAEGE